MLGVLVLTSYPLEQLKCVSTFYKHSSFFNASMCVRFRCNSSQLELRLWLWNKICFSCSVGGRSIGVASSPSGPDVGMTLFPHMKVDRLWSCYL